MQTDAARRTVHTMQRTLRDLADAPAPLRMTQAAILLAQGDADRTLINTLEALAGEQPSKPGRDIMDNAKTVADLMELVDVTPFTGFTV